MTEASTFEMNVRVTSRVVQQVKLVGPTQRQIAVSLTSDPEQRLGSATKKSPRLIYVARLFELRVGDTSAIWGTQQDTEERIRNFDSLYDLLARFPDRSATFVCLLE